MGYTQVGKEMIPTPERIVADSQSRIHNSESFAARKKCIKQEMLLTLNVEIESAGWIKRHLILWDIDRKSEKRTRDEICPFDALYVKTK